MPWWRRLTYSPVSHQKPVFQVTDDSGFLALVVPAAYETFVASNWTFDQIMGHFKGQMARRSLLIWGTGLEGFWNVDVVLNKSKAKGYRESAGRSKLPVALCF
jgi:hypothetical protein